MKLQKTILAASLALVAAGANASGEIPKSPDAVHHVISKATSSVGNYAKVHFDANGVRVAAPVANGSSQDALDYLYTQLKATNGQALQANAVKLAELDLLYAQLDGVSPNANGVLSFFANTAAAGQPRNFNGTFEATNFVTTEVPRLDIYADLAAPRSTPLDGFVNTYNNPAKQNIVSPVYGRDTVLSLRAISNAAGLGDFSNGIDLNSRKAIVDSATGSKYQLVKYGTDAAGIYQFYEITSTGIDYDKPAFGGKFYTRTLAGNLVETIPTGEVDKSTIVRAGQYDLSATGTGEEIKLITDEHLTYGFKSTQNVTGRGNLVVPGEVGLGEAVGSSVQNVTGEGKSKYDYVNVGVVANTFANSARLAGETEENYQVRLRAAHYANPDKSIYGVSAERTSDNGVRNITTLTGYGLSLSNLGRDANAILNFDGSVTRNDGGATQGLPVLAQYYENLGGVANQNIVKVSAVGEDPQYFTVNGTRLSRVDSARVEQLENLISSTTEATLTGTAVKTVDSASVTEHNVVTNQMTQYYTERTGLGGTDLVAKVTNPDRSRVIEFEPLSTASDANVNVAYAQLGNLNLNGIEQYGVRVYNGTKGSTDGSYANLTAQGLVTNGKVEAKTLIVDGKDVTKFLKDSVAPQPTNPTDPTNPTNPTNPGAGGVTDAVVDTKVEAKAKVTLEAANAYTDTKVDGAIKTASVEMTKAASEAATTAATKVVDSKVETASIETLKSANTYTDKAVSTVNSRVDQLNTRVDHLSGRVDDVERTANRGVAIALAAQQAVPNIAPGQVAVFGGVGHYEGETAGSIGVVTSFTDRISASGAFGFASGSEFGGRVGVSYVFGGK